MQDFDSFGFHGIDYDVRERRQRQFFCAAAVAGPASVRKGLQKADILVDRPHGRLCEMRLALLQIVLDVLEIVSSGGQSNGCASGVARVKP